MKENTAYVKNDIGPRMERLPVSKWSKQVFWLIALGLVAETFDNQTTGILLAQLVKNGWSNNFLNAVFASCSMAGLLIGSLFAGYLGDHFGRKTAYQINLLIFGVPTLISAFLPNIESLIAMRFIMGIGIGAEMVVGFATITEFFPANCRGLWSSRLSLISNVPPSILYLFAALAMPLFGDEYGWRVLLFAIGCFSIYVWYLRKHMPESPRWYAARGDYAKANELLTQVERDIEAQQGIKLPPPAETESIIDANAKKGSFTDLFQGRLLRTTILAICVLAGMNVSFYTILTWVPTIFVQQGIAVNKSLLMTSFMLLGAPLGIWLTTLFVDKFPRKWLGVTSLLLVGIVGYFYSLQRDTTSILAVGFLMMTLLYVYTCFASAVYVPELWPTEIRLRGSGFCNAVGRGVAIVTPYAVAWILTNFGSTGVFAAVGAALAFVALVIAVIGIETRGVSVEQIGKQAGMRC